MFGSMAHMASPLSSLGRHPAPAEALPRPRRLLTPVRHCRVKLVVARSHAPNEAVEVVATRVLAIWPGVTVAAGASFALGYRRRQRRRRAGVRLHCRRGAEGAMTLDVDSAEEEPAAADAEGKRKKLTCVRLSDYRSSVHQLKDGLIHADEIDGVSTGWCTVDQVYRPVRGEFTVLTGVPGSGKSEFCLALATKLVQKHGWRIGICSFEAKLDDIVRQLVEKRGGMRFDEMEPAQRQVLYDGFLKPHFKFIAADFMQPSLNQVLQKAQEQVDAEGLDALLVDPYNYIDRSQSTASETDFAKGLLVQLKQFAKKNKCHVWLVAHPGKRSSWASFKEAFRRKKKAMLKKGDEQVPPKQQRPVPSLYDISGSAHFNNVCDMGLVLDADLKENKLTVHVQKVRNRDAGTVGTATLWFNKDSRCFTDCHRGQLEKLWSEGEAYQA